MAAIDMAAWDVLAKSTGLSLSRLLGGEEKPIPAYHSLGMAAPEGAAREAAESIGLGFRCVKFKVGYPHVEQDRYTRFRWRRTKDSARNYAERG
jgi:mandelate racemase